MRVLIPTPGHMGVGAFVSLGGYTSAIYKVPDAARTPGPLHLPSLRALVESCKKSSTVSSSKKGYRTELGGTAVGALGTSVSKSLLGELWRQGKQLQSLAKPRCPGLIW